MVGVRITSFTYFLKNNFVIECIQIYFTMHGWHAANILYKTAVKFPTKEHADMLCWVLVETVKATRLKKLPNKKRFLEIII